MRGGTVAAAVLMMVIGFIFVSFLGVNFVSQGGLMGVFSPTIIGILLMLLGFILFIAGLAASPKEEKQPIIIQAPAPYMPPQQISQPITTVLAICPNCKNGIPAESKFCPECGYVLHAISSASQVPPPPPIEQISQSYDTPRFCENCGTPYEDGNFCKKCGAKVG